MVKDLEFRKVQAIDNEDYESAKIIKVELDKVKKTLMSVTALPNMRASSMTSRGSIRTSESDRMLSHAEMTDPGRQMLKSVSQIESDLKRVNVNFEMTDPAENRNEDFQIHNTYNESIGNFTNQPAENAMQVMRPDSHQSQNNYQPSQVSMDRQSMMPREYAEENYGQNNTFKAKQFDDTVVPMHNKNPIDFGKIKDDKGGQQIGEENEEEKLTDQDKAKIEIMKQYFDEESVKLLYSKKWQNRKKGLEEFIKQLPQSMKAHGIAAQEHAISIFLTS